jgi:hypothetical protein
MNDSCGFTGGDISPTINRNRLRIHSKAVEPESDFFTSLKNSEEGRTQRLICSDSFVLFYGDNQSY